MAHTKKVYVSLKKLQASGLGVLAVRLMMACNDIKLANQCLQQYRASDSPTRRHLTRGAGMYFIRLQIAHLVEGLKILEEASNKPRFVALLDRHQARERYEELLQFKSSSPWRRYTEGARDKTFHYSGDEVEQAIELRVDGVAALSGFTLSVDPDLYRFDVADDIYDTLLCRVMWQREAGPNLMEQVDTILAEIRSTALKFLDFCEDLLLPVLEDSRV